MRTDDRSVTTRLLSKSIFNLHRLSVTKWIHIHHGDDGLLAFFDQLQQITKPGALLLFEPHEWASYKRNLKGFPSQIQKTIDGLRFRPEDFPSMLEKKGFRLVKQIWSPTDNRPRSLSIYERKETIQPI